MLEVNLSRIHNMLRNASNRIRQLQADIAAGNASFTMDIFKATTEADLAEFRKRIFSVKTAVLKKKREIELRLDYITYLKAVLDRENSRQGISDKLQELAAIQRKQAELERYRGNIFPFCAEEWQYDRSVDYYKSAFTEEKPFFTLSLKLFNSDYPAELRKERDRLEARRQILDDDLASLNQTIMVSIMSFEEFEASREDVPEFREGPACPER